MLIATPRRGHDKLLYMEEKIRQGWNGSRLDEVLNPEQSLGKGLTEGLLFFQRNPASPVSPPR